MKKFWFTAILLGTMLFLSGTALASGPVCFFCNSTDTEWLDYEYVAYNLHYHYYYCYNPRCVSNEDWNHAKLPYGEICSFTIPASCTKGASCACGNTSGNPVHAEVVDAAVAPTCAQTGLTEGKHCSLCAAVLVAQQTVPKTAHTAATDAAVAPTCAQAGRTEGSHCSVCAAVIVAQQTVPAAHTAVTDAAVAPTCAQTGLTEGSHCSVCAAVLVAQEIAPATGHTEVTDAAVAPTCTQTGRTEGSHCSVCAAVLVAQEAVPATGHTAATDAAVAPTCTQAGRTEGSHCSVCAAVLVAQEAVPALRHQHRVTVTQPTCSREGYSTFTCTRCEKRYVTDVTSARGHRYGTWTGNGDDTHSATCQSGSCGSRKTENCEYAEVTGTDQPFRVCVVCGALKGIASENLEASAAFPLLAGATAEPVQNGTLPRGELAVHGQEAPCDGVLYALTVAFTSAGQSVELAGPVRVCVPYEGATAFRLFQVDGEALTELPFTCEDGILRFELDRAGLLFLTAAE